MNKAETAVKIVPSDEEAYTVVSVGEQVWRKKYPSMSAATSEALELQILAPNDKGLRICPNPCRPMHKGSLHPQSKSTSMNSSSEASSKISEPKISTNSASCSGAASPRLLANRRAC